MSSPANSKPQPTILIVGAGPAGLVLALSLLQHGVPIRIIAKEREYRPGQRGSGVMPRTLELHNLLGTLPDVLKHAREYPPIRLYKLPGGTETLKEFSLSPHLEPTVDRPYLNGLALGQDEHERILREHLAKYGCHVELGRELLSFEQHDDHVVARIATTTTSEEDGSVTTTETTEAYQWLIGADGGRSSVRKSLKGVSFLGETRNKERMVVGDIHLRGLDRDHWHFWGDASSTLVTLRPVRPESDSYSIVIAGLAADCAHIASSREAFIDSFRNVTGRTDVEFGELVWISYFTPNMRMVNTFQEGRAILIGDAAHTHSPTGGQGMNSSVQDALNLGWKLALVHKHLASPTLLPTYTLERLPIIAEMLNITTSLHTKTFTDTTSDAHQRGGDLNQLGVNYRFSPIVVDERATEEVAGGSVYSVDLEKGVRAGDRAPEAPGLVDGTGKTRSVFGIVGASWHTVFAFAADGGLVGELRGCVGKFADGLVKVVVVSPKGEKVLGDVGGAGVLVVEDRDGHAAKAYGVGSGDGSWVFVVRPDGVIGAIVKGVEGLEAYFKSIFV